MPPPSHIQRQPKSTLCKTQINSAEIVIPVPTPAKCQAARSPRRAALSRSSTSVEASTSTKALAAPPMNRKLMNHARPSTNPIAPVVIALAARDHTIHLRVLPGKRGEAAARAPARYPAKFAPAISPAWPLLRSRSSIMGGKDRRIDETPDANRACHRDETAERKRAHVNGRFVHAVLDSFNCRARVALGQTDFDGPRGGPTGRGRSTRLAAGGGQR